MTLHKLTAWLLALAAWALCAPAQAFNDAKALGLKGQVKSLILPAGCNPEEMPFYGVRELTFNEDGSLATIDGKTPAESTQWKIERNNAGLITKVVNNDGYSVYTTQLTYTTKERIASSTTTLKGEKANVVYSFVYNTMGHVSRFFNKSGGASDEFRYQYGETDSHLNWITRSYVNASGSTVTQSRHITYWDDAAPETEESTYLSSDLQMRELKGNVKLAKWYDKEEESDCRTYGFTQKGQWTTFDGMALSKSFSKVERDAKGRVKSTLEGENDQVTLVEYSYNTAGFVAQQNVDYGIDGYSKETFSYSRQGVLETSRIVENMGYDAPDEPAVTFTYTILSSDSQGNWTRRQVKGSDGRNRVEKRVIGYY